MIALLLRIGKASLMCRVKRLRAYCVSMRRESLQKYALGSGGGGTRGMCYFSNAYIESSTRAELLKHNHQFLLVDSISATKINDKGVAESGSLREIEVVIPLSLYGSIENVPNEFVSLMSATLKKIKRMGLNRTRGLGRCEIDILESAQKGEVK